MAKGGGLACCLDENWIVEVGWGGNDWSIQTIGCERDNKVTLVGVTGLRQDEREK